MTDDSIITRPFWDMFNSHNATSFSGVPFTYEMLLKTRLLKKDLPSLTVMTQAGGKLAPEKVKEIAEYARDNNISFYVMYGQTEATARISYLPPEANLGKPDSIGIAIPGGELSLRDTNGVPITESGIDGELIYRGPNVMQGYAEGADDLKNGDDLKGILATGDVARMDDDGYFYITGRLKRFIKIFGNRVNLDEVELFLRSSGYPAACGGEDDSLCIATTDRDSEEAIKKAIVARYGFHHSAVAVTTVPEIPRNSSGKILYQQMFEDMFS
jgi:acyl-coenzyme A synthetase/AMP-(fatty) acid ligase